MKRFLTKYNLLFIVLIFGFANSSYAADDTNCYPTPGQPIPTDSTIWGSHGKCYAQANTFTVQVYKLGLCSFTNRDSDILASGIPNMSTSCFTVYDSGTSPTSFTLDSISQQISINGTLPPIGSTYNYLFIQGANDISVTATENFAAIGSNPPQTCWTVPTTNTQSRDVSGNTTYSASTTVSCQDTSSGTPITSGKVTNHVLAFGCHNAYFCGPSASDSMSFGQSNYLTTGGASANYPPSPTNNADGMLAFYPLSAPYNVTASNQATFGFLFHITNAVKVKYQYPEEVDPSHVNFYPGELEIKLN